MSIARKATKKFLDAYASTRDPLDIQRKGEEFDGAPAYQLYIRGADELAYHLKNNPVEVAVGQAGGVQPAAGRGQRHTDHFGAGHGHQNQRALRLTRSGGRWRKRRAEKRWRWKKE